MAEAFCGNWKSLSATGDMDKFFQERGIPFPIRKILEFLASRGEFIFEIKDADFVETEVGNFKNTVKEPLPLDGTEVPTIAPDGQKAMTKLVMEDGKMKMVHKMSETDVVIHEFSQNGNNIIRKVINGSTGTFFTVTLGRKA
mmetsp:Transcript_11292/g.15499  ORF Transcript_11292/g.15499 Transcript_11292/m.15499 type:complete len:142 (-) Transcript_11292:219-644(-)